MLSAHELNLQRSLYAYRSGTPTEKTLHHLVGKVEKTQKQYVLGVFFDIEGAFNHVVPTP